VTEALQARGHDVTLLCARLGDGNPDPRVGTIVEAGASESRIGAEMSRLLATKSVDLVIERYALESGKAAPLCARERVPHLLEVNAPIVLEAARHRDLKRVDAWLRREKATFTSAGLIMVVSSELARYVRRVVPEAVVAVIPNGVDVQRFGSGPAMDLGLPPDSIVIGFAGSMKPWHGVEDLLTASDGVLARNPQVVLVLAGDGPQMPCIRDQVTSLGLSPRVRVLGALEHQKMPSLLRGIDVAVAPYRPSSDFYFSPIKVLEYMASGCATVYPRIGDLPHMVAGSGVDYRAGEVRGLESAIERLVTDAPMRAELGRRGRQRAFDFTWDRVVSSIEELVQPALASSR
jgi:glycosyltransferase involved in cell wall biosynthesis